MEQLSERKEDTMFHSSWLKWGFGVVLGDVHIPFHDSVAMDLVFQFIKDTQPSLIILNGDIVDFWESSHFARVREAGAHLADEIAEAKDILFFLRKIAPNAKIVYNAGNHEFRLRRYIISQADALQGLSCLSIPELLGLPELRIEYNDVQYDAAKFISNDYRVGNLYVGHYDRATKYSVANLIDNLGCSLIQGHDHRVTMYSKSLRDGTHLIGVGHGCLCTLHPSYVAFPNWQHGFAVFYYEKAGSEFRVLPVRIENHEFFFGLKEYTPESAKRLYAATEVPKPPTI